MLKEAMMTITVEVPPEVEARLAAQAKSRGLSLDAFLRSIITTQAVAIESAKSPELLPREGDVDRAIDELFDTVQVPQGIGEGALRRENWYR
jgi:hypothetical protein